MIGKVRENAMATEPMSQSTAFAAVRRWPRYKLNVPVRVISQKDGKSVITPSRGNELNGGGLSIFAGVELAEGDDVELEFTPPYSGDPIRVRCIVRNRREYSYGLEFHLDTEEDMERVSMIRAVFMGMGSRIT
jgi:hypothetical protein